jgi:hypothetical protein
VLFSAAIPGQGGTHHVNERWQDYWASLFNRHRYVPVDCIRKSVWDDADVAWWYAQNTLLYCERRYAMANPALARELEDSRGLPLRIVHPRKLQEMMWRERWTRAAYELAGVIGHGAAFFLVDDAATGDAFAFCGQPIPFPEKDGAFAGSPADSDSAIADMRSLRSSASHIVIVEPAFWWLGHYPDWFEFLKANSRSVLETKDMRVFELAPLPHLPSG